MNNQQLHFILLKLYSKDIVRSQAQKKIQDLANKHLQEKLNTMLKGIEPLVNPDQFALIRDTVFYKNSDEGDKVDNKYPRKCRFLPTTDCYSSIKCEDCSHGPGKYGQD